MNKIREKIGHPDHGYGLLPDLPGSSYDSVEDHVVRLLQKLTFPKETDNVLLAPRVWSQGRTGSCTGHGFACVVHTTLATHHAPLTSRPRPRILYTLGRAVDRSGPKVPLRDVGASPNSVVRALARWGCLLEGESDEGTSDDAEYTAYLEEHVNDEPMLGELEISGDRLLGGFNLIGDDAPDKVDLVKTALANGYAVGVAVAAGNDQFQSFDGRGVLDYCGSRPDHWVALIDYRTRQDGSLEFLLQNSWGTDLWTPDGRAWVTEDFVRLGCFNSLVARLTDAHPT